MTLVADKGTRDKLKATRDHLAELRANRTNLRKERDAAKDAFAKEDTDFSASGDKSIYQNANFLAAQNAVKELGELEDTISQAEGAERALLAMLGESGGAGVSGDVAAGNIQTPQSIGWDGRALLASSGEYADAVERGKFESSGQFGTVQLGQVADRDSFMRTMAAALPAAPGGVNVGTDQGAVMPDVRGIYPPALKRLSLLDLIPTGTTDSNVVQYVQVTGLPGSAAETAELALKPQSGITFEDQTAPVRTIAAFMKLSRQSLSDMMGLSSLINLLLPYDVKRRLELQILLGDGTGQNLLGILNSTGIGAPAAVSGDTVADSILRAITTVVLSDGDPQFVTMNPLTWLEIATMKASGSGNYMFANPGGAMALYQQPTIWGLSVTQNRLIPQSSPLVGDPLGATLLVREGVNVRLSDADQDDFVRNRVTMLAETRVALPIWRPSAFAVANVPSGDIVSPDPDAGALQ